MKGTDTSYSTVSLCMPVFLLMSVFLYNFMQGAIPDMAFSSSSLIMVMAAAACGGIICGIAGLVKHENMKWMSVAGMVMNAALAFICYVVLQAL